MRRFAVIVVLTLLLLPFVAQAFTVYPVPYSGSLFESGVPVNGNRYISISVYSVPVGGSPLATQAESLAVVDGIFHTQLAFDSALWDGSDRWVGVSVNGGAQFIPRVSVGYVPSAVHTPHLNPQLFTTSSVSRNVTSTQWTRIDSVVVNVTGPGFAQVNLTGYVLWNGAVSIPPIELALSPTTPTTYSVVHQPTQTGSLAGLAMSQAFPVASGQTTIYWWGRIPAAGQSYAVHAKQFQALFIPTN